MRRRPRNSDSLARPNPARARLAISLDSTSAPGGGAAGLLELPAEDLAPRTPAARFRTRTGLAAAVLLMVVAMLAGSWLWWQAATRTPTVLPLTDAPALTGEAPAPGPEPAASGPADAEKPAPEPILVHVVGAVARPGVVELPAGSRLFEAIAAAGGGTEAADPARLNLATVLADGLKVIVPARGEPDPPELLPGGSAGSGTDPGPGGQPAGSRKIDLNTADVTELATLPRVGPVLAQRIVDWREQHGRFTSVEELDAVEGVGPKMLEALRPLVTI